METKEGEDFIEGIILKQWKNAGGIYEQAAEEVEKERGEAD